MKKFLTISNVLLLIILVFNIGLAYQYIRLKWIASNSDSLLQHAEWTTFFCIGNVGHSVSLDSAATGHHLLLRYNTQTCLTCITKAEELLLDVFGKEYLMKELCCVGEFGQVKADKDFLYIQSDAHISPADDVYTPYISIINDSGDILFTLSLIPDMYDYNRKILLKLKKSMQCQ